MINGISRLSPLSTLVTSNDVRKAGKRHGKNVTSLYTDDQLIPVGADSLENTVF